MEHPSPKQGQAMLIWAAGAFCIYGWEFFVCLPKERSLIWSRPKNWFSILYIANRYFGLIQFALVVSMSTDVWSTSACRRIYLFEPIGGLISIVLSQVILGARVYALYSQSKLLALILVSILVGQIIIGAIATSGIDPPPTIPLGVPGLPPDFQPPPCGSLSAQFRWQVTYWTVPLFYDTLTFVLTAWKAHGLWREQLNTRLFDIIWHDGLLYFFAILTMNIVNVIIFLAAPPGIRDVNLAPTIMLEIILSCRLVLNLRDTQNQSQYTSRVPKRRTTLISPVKSVRWESSAITGSQNLNQLETPEINLEVYGKVPTSKDMVFNIDATHSV
ncbi:hypothetical protein JR316_0006679 [Psilocybe cubensis]|uniref:DUF6533 domain-containing protein n=2 Tax=Psilocybe cubensis TaxID=181762 RepID=A0A8H7XLZ6_PSICU|nr:hypothetical protein JR316_0006679 [Psilocybe cubensis]KAH9480082.1 hypothetical protein JR316_0006679 [Psilocybe cubensis]